jgi:O-methyltransferase
MKRLVQSTFNAFGLSLVKSSYWNNRVEAFPSDFEPSEVSLAEAVAPYTMTSRERIYTLIHAVQYLTQHQIPGDIVECGVWKGGSMMAIAKTLLQLGQQDRHLYLFDTYSGMSEPSEKDACFNGESAVNLLETSDINDERSVWCNASLQQVKDLMYSTGYPTEKIHFVEGKVEDTLPQNAPDQIALLRLDTDWYESTRHELIHLFPRLSQHGIIVIDDYGFWKGAKLAVDEYFQQQQTRIFLSRIDDTGRVGVKL